MADLMLSVLWPVARFERDLIKERQREGIALAKQRGAYRGQRKALSGDRAADLRLAHCRSRRESRPRPRTGHQPRNAL